MCKTKRDHGRGTCYKHRDILKGLLYRGIARCVGEGVSDYAISLRVWTRRTDYQDVSCFIRQDGRVPLEPQFMYSVPETQLAIGSSKWNQYVLSSLFHLYTCLLFYSLFAGMFINLITATLLLTFVVQCILKLSIFVVHESHVIRTSTATFLTFIESWADDGVERNFAAIMWK